MSGATIISDDLVFPFPDDNPLLRFSSPPWSKYFPSPNIFLRFLIQIFSSFFLYLTLTSLPDRAGITDCKNLYFKKEICEISLPGIPKLGARWELFHVQTYWVPGGTQKDILSLTIRSSQVAFPCWRGLKTNINWGQSVYQPEEMSGLCSMLWWVMLSSRFVISY